MVRVIVNDTVVAESSETVFVEGNHYFPPESIKVVLTISPKTMHNILDPDFLLVSYTCPYKGHASYYNAEVAGSIVKDIAWVYPQPTSKFEIKGRYAFDKAQVQVVEQPA